MHDFSLNQRYKAVICCDAFYHNLSPQHERSCLMAVHRHLLDGGRFLFNIHNNPNPKFLGWLSTPEAAVFHKRGEYRLPGSANTLIIQQALHHDPQEQIIRTRLRFAVTGQDGAVVEQTDSEWTTRYLCKYEMIYLLELCGFSIESLLGGYREESVSTEGQLVFVARKAASG